MDIQRPLPKDTAALVDADPGLKGCQNLGLILDRLNPWEPDGDGWDLAFIVEERKQGIWAEDTKKGGEAKGLWLSNRRDDQRARLIDTPLLREQRIDSTLLARYHARWEQLAADFGADQASGLRFSMIAESRLVVGLGTDTVIDTNITLHRLYGFPIIPASALKGVARTYALLSLAETLGVPALDWLQRQSYQPKDKKEKKRKTPLQQLVALLEADLTPRADDQPAQRKLHGMVSALNSDAHVAAMDGLIRTLNFDAFAAYTDVRRFRDVFGALNQVGGARFFDAVPRHMPILAADVINPHFPKYYRSRGKPAASETNAPSDADKPQPVTFLTVEAGTAFDFAVAPHRRENAVDQAAAQQAIEWLRAALIGLGIGAKTGSGYGYFGTVAPRPGTARDEPTIPDAVTQPGSARFQSPLSSAGRTTATIDTRQRGQEPTSTQQRMNGYIQHFDDDKPFGFIGRVGAAAGERGIHVSITNMPGRQRLPVGEPVNFVIGQTDKGSTALDVQRGHVET